MDTYSTLRHLADSWVLAALFAIFVGAVLFAWRPGSRGLHAEASLAPFRHDDRPPSAGPCGRSCEGCACGPEGAR